MTVRDEFRVHMLNEQGKAKATQLAERFSTFLTDLEQLVPGPCREMSIVKTKLEEASYYAKRAMASQPVNQESPSAPANPSPPFNGFNRL